MTWLRRSGRVSGVVLLVAAYGALLPSSALAKIPDCAGARVVVEGGVPSPFVLPDMAGQTVSVAPEQPVTLRGENVPPGARLRLSVAGLGGLAGVTRDVSGGVTTVRIADYVPLKSGLYALDGVLLAGGQEVCSVRFSATLGEFGGPVAVGATAASAATGLGALASVPYSASGMTLKLRANVAIHRRRPRGLRRWLPVPAWKRTILGMIIGAITGLCVSLLLQQGGITPLSLANAVRSAIVGGGVTFAAGYSIGAIITYLRPPKEA